MIYLYTRELMCMKIIIATLFRVFMSTKDNWLYKLQNIHKVEHYAGIKKKDRLVWWLMPVTPVLLKAEAGGSPEVRSSRSGWPTW